jgi:hypothetical protein
MSEHLNLKNSIAWARELEREAELWRLAHANGNGRAKAADPSRTLVIRTGQADDAGALERLSQLDGRRSRVHTRVLVAEVDGEVLAALPLNGARPIADPFQPTADLVEMLRLRAADLLDCGSTRGGLRDRVSRLLRSGGRRPAVAPATPGNARMLIPRD